MKTDYADWRPRAFLLSTRELPILQPGMCVQDRGGGVGKVTMVARGRVLGKSPFFHRGQREAKPQAFVVAFGDP